MKVFVGNFYGEQIQNGEDKRALKKVQEETGLKYNICKIKGKGQDEHISLWACDIEETSFELK